jgi:hypothetical protein
VSAGLLPIVLVAVLDLEGKSVRNGSDVVPSSIVLVLVVVLDP